MKITNEKIYEIVGGAISPEAVLIVKYLEGRKNISDFKISEKTKLDIQQVRNLLYRLHEKNLVTYIRKKDRLKGWYISYFTFNKKGVRYLVEKLRKEQIDKYKERLAEEENGTLFFICPNLCVRLDFERSTELEFHCPECGSLLKQQDNDKTRQHLKEKIKELEIEG